MQILQTALIENDKDNEDLEQNIPQLYLSFVYNSHPIWPQMYVVQYSIIIKFFIKIYLFRYDAEATYFEEGVRTAKQKQLEEKLLQVMLLYYYLVS